MEINTTLKVKIRLGEWEKFILNCQIHQNGTYWEVYKFFLFPSDGHFCTVQL